MDITKTIHRYLTTAPASHFVGQTVTVLDAWEGSENLLWRVECRGQAAVVKLYLDAGQARGRRQFDAHERYAPFGLAPRPLWFDRYPEGLSRQLLVYEWTPGDPLSVAEPAQAAALALAIARVHQADPSTVRRFCPNPLNLDYFWRILRGGMGSAQQWLMHATDNPLGAWLAQLTTRAERLVQAALPLWGAAQPTPVHGDLRPENVLYRFGDAILLDWELFGLGDPALDVARLLQQSRPELERAGQTEWLAHYLAVVEQPGLGERIAAYDQLLPLQAASFLLNGLRHYMQRPAGDDAVAEVMPFLQIATSTALAQAATALQMDVAVDEVEGAVAETLHTLFSAQTSP